MPYALDNLIIYAKYYSLRIISSWGNVLNSSGFQIILINRLSSPIFISFIWIKLWTPVSINSLDQAIKPLCLLFSFFQDNYGIFGSCTIEFSNWEDLPWCIIFICNYVLATSPVVSPFFRTQLIARRILLFVIFTMRPFDWSPDEKLRRNNFGILQQRTLCVKYICFWDKIHNTNLTGVYWSKKPHA